MQGAVNATIEDLTLTGAVDGVFAPSGANSTGLTVSGCTLFGNSDDGILLDTTNDYATLSGNIVYGGQGGPGAQQINGLELYVNYSTISGNTIYDHSGTGIYLSNPAVGETISNNLVYGNVTGIYVVQNSSAALGDSDLISDNTIRTNITTGINANGYVLLSGNTVYGQSANNATGIYGNGGAEVADNIVYGNYNGIVSYGLNIQNNRLYNNSNVAIYAYGESPIESNDIYSNNIGVQAGSVYYGPIDDNLIYANTTYGILLEDSNNDNAVDVFNNTIYQVVGTAVRLDGGAAYNELRNNILWTQGGYDIYVADNSQTGFSSDYNDLYLSGGSTANVGFWNSAVNNGVQSQLSNWQADTGQDCALAERESRLCQHHRRGRSARLHATQRDVCRLRRGRQLLPVRRFAGDQPRRFLDGAVDRHPRFPAAGRSRHSQPGKPGLLPRCRQPPAGVPQRRNATELRSE